jgi:hypothetical protein
MLISTITHPKPKIKSNHQHPNPISAKNPTKNLQNLPSCVTIYPPKETPNNKTKQPTKKQKQSPTPTSITNTNYKASQEKVHSESSTSAKPSPPVKNSP